MSYAPVLYYPSFGQEPIPPPPPPPPSASDEPLSGGKVALLVVGGAAIVGIIGFAIYTDYKISRDIAQKEGSAGLLKYQGGKAAIGLASAYLSPREVR